MNRSALEPLIERLWPGAQLLDAALLDPDAAVVDDTHKIAGYGLPFRVRVRCRNGNSESAVVHFVGRNDFGHDRRADRAAAQLLAWDTFDQIPGHAQALDVGALLRDGKYLSLRDAGELYLVTRYVEGRPYAEDLRRIARSAALDARALSGEAPRAAWRTARSLSPLDPRSRR
jgi:hypothetical protein